MIQIDDQNTRLRPVRPTTRTAGATTVAGAPQRRTRPTGTGGTGAGAPSLNTASGTPIGPGGHPLLTGGASSSNPLANRPQGDWSDPNNVNGQYGRSAGTAVAQYASSRPPRPGARPMAPGSQAPAPIRPAQPGSVITTTAQPPQPSGNLRSDVFVPGGEERYLSEQDAALEALGGPNRTDLAKQALSDFDALDAENRHQRYRQIGQNAARLGRLGMGDTGQEVVNQGRLFEADRARFANELARSVAEGDIGDRFRRVDVTSGLRRGESDIGRGYRDEFRFERGRQDDLAQRGIDNRIRERELGNSEMDQRFRQALARFAMGQEGIPRLDELLMQYGGG